MILWHLFTHFHLAWVRLAIFPVAMVIVVQGMCWSLGWEHYDLIRIQQNNDVVCVGPITSHKIW